MCGAEFYGQPSMGKQFLVPFEGICVCEGAIRVLVMLWDVYLVAIGWRVCRAPCTMFHCSCLPVPCLETIGGRHDVLTTVVLVENVLLSAIERTLLHF